MFDFDAFTRFDKYFFESFQFLLGLEYYGRRVADIKLAYLVAVVISYVFDGIRNGQIFDLQIAVFKFCI